MLDFESALTDIQNASSGNLAFGQLDKALQSLGFNRAVYSLMTDHASIGEKAFHGVSTNYPDDWLKYYADRDYFNIDPVVNRALKVPGSFYWDDIVEVMRRDHTLSAESICCRVAMMQEAEEAGLVDGIGISFVNEYGEITGMGFSRADKEGSKDYRILSDVSVLGHVFHEKYMSYFNPKPIPSLSNREKEVLLWSAEGKSDLDISHILNISRATVRFHWNNIFKKLGVNNKILATITALRCKIIIPYTVKSLVRR